MSEAADRRPGSARAAALRAGLTGLWFAGVAAAQCAAALEAPSTSVLGHPRTDTLKHLWTLWWSRAAPVAEGGAGLHTLLVNFPEGLTLYPIEPLSGLVALALGPLPLPLVANLLTWLNLLLTGVAGAALGRQLSGHWQGGLIAGTLLQTSAVTAHLFALGVGELQQLWLLPLVLTLQLRAQAAGGLAAWARLGLGLALSAAACFYYGLFGGLMVACLSAAQVLTGPDRARALAHNGVAIGVLAVTLAPVAALFADSYAVAPPPTADCSPVYDAVDARLELWTTIWPQGFANDPPATAYLGGTYLGLGALGLALAGLVRAPRRALPLLAGGVLGVVLALGSYYSVGGAEVVEGGARTVLPMRALNGLLAAVAEPLNFPVRAVSMAVVALAGMAALALPAKIPARAARVSALLALLPAVDPLLLGQAAWPLPLTRPRATPVVASWAVPGPVADLRLAARPDAEAREAALLLQIAHGKPVQGVPISRLAEAAPGGQRHLAVLPSVRGIQRGGRPEVDALKRDLAVLWELGFRAVSWSEGWAGASSPTVRALEAALGAPEVQGEGFWIWSMPAPDPAIDLPAAMAAHADAVAAAAPAAAGGSLAALQGAEACPGGRAQRSDLGLLRTPPFADEPGPRLRLAGVAAWASPPSNPADNDVELTLVVHRLPATPGAQPEAEGAIRLERPGPFALEAPVHAGALRLSVLRGGAEGGGMPLGQLELPVESLSLEDLHIHLHPER